MINYLFKGFQLSLGMLINRFVNGLSRSFAANLSMTFHITSFLEHTKPTRTYKEPNLPSVGEQTDIIVTHVVSPHEIYVQKVSIVLVNINYYSHSGREQYGR